MKTIKRLKWIVLILAIVIPSLLMAQDQGPTVLGGSSRTGTAGAQFLQIGVSARAAGMGETFVAFVDDASGAYYNPGVLVLIPQRQALFNHTIDQTGFRHARLGMSVTNFGPDLNFGDKSSVGFKSQSFPMPITFRFGAVVDVMHGETNKLWLAGQLLQPNDNLCSESFGLEYSYRDLIFLRGGWKIDEENEGPDKDGFAETLSLGAGLNLAVSGFTGKFDFSWSQMSYLDDLARFSILVGF